MDKKSHKVTIEVLEPKYKRWKYADKSKRVLMIDFRCIRAVPYKPVDYGARRVYIWKNPLQLKDLVDEYFASCYGPIRNPKTGGFYENPDGSFVIGQIKPFTLSGLALYTHTTTKMLRKYSNASIDALGYPTEFDYEGLTYSGIINEARKRIETYAEEQLYSRDGFGGGRFVLDAGFDWVSNKEQAEITSMNKQNSLKKKELKLKKKQMKLDNDVIEPISITIRKAGEQND